MDGTSAFIYYFKLFAAYGGYYLSRLVEHYRDYPYEIQNVGYVCHYVYCYGNFKDLAYVSMTFDTHVVPPADYTRDYEQLWREQETASGRLKDFVDGQSSHKGYYTEEGVDRRREIIDEVNRRIDAVAL